MGHRQEALILTVSQSVWGRAEAVCIRLSECSGMHSAVSITQCLLRSALLLLVGSVKDVGMRIIVDD